MSQALTPIKEAMDLTLSKQQLQNSSVNIATSPFFDKDKKTRNLKFANMASYFPQEEPNLFENYYTQVNTSLFSTKNRPTLIDSIPVSTKRSLKNDEVYLAQGY